jgi:hypothetical protein
MSRARLDPFLILLFAVFIARIWLMALPSSLWVDELVTVFVVNHPGDPSFAVAPQVPQSIYYGLASAAQTLLGRSEIALRIPSILAMGAALFFLARLAARLVHPLAGWFAVFAALAFRPFDYFALDARPYGLGIAVVLAALLWRIHLFYWPFYLVYLAYAGVRLWKRDTPLDARRVALAAAILAAALAPVALNALKLSREAGAHAFNPQPTLRNLFYLAHGNVIAACLAGGWLLRRVLRWPVPTGQNPGVAAFALCFAWWLACPLCLFAYSRFSGNGVLIMRYVSLMLPGCALAATAVAGRFLPAGCWKPAALAIGVVALAFLGDWQLLWPKHERDDWRDAAALERTVAGAATPVLCPSPFIEAQSPVWTPDYPLPGFLYAHLPYYPLTGRVALFPFTPSRESERYAERLMGEQLVPSREFVLYGSTWSLRALARWFALRPELAGWHREWKSFDAISVVVYRAPGRV